MASPPRTPEKHASLTSLPVPPGSRPESRQPSLNNVRPSRDASFSGGHRMKRSFSNPGEPLKEPMKSWGSFLLRLRLSDLFLSDYGVALLRVKAALPIAVMTHAKLGGN